MFVWEDLTRYQKSKSQLELVLEHRKAPESYNKHLRNKTRREQKNLTVALSRLAGVLQTLRATDRRRTYDGSRKNDKNGTSHLPLSQIRHRHVNRFCVRFGLDFLISCSNLYVSYYFNQGVVNVRFLDYVRTQVNPLTPRFEITGQCYFNQSTGPVSFQQIGFWELDPKPVLTVNAITATQKQIKLGHLLFCTVSCCVLFFIIYLNSLCFKVLISLSA